MAFWNMKTVEPKRSFRYKVTFGSKNLNSQVSLFAQKVDKPSYTMEAKEYQYLNHTFKYPGRVKWSDITMEFVDAGSGPIVGSGQDPVDMATTLMGIISKSGYMIPETVGQKPADLLTPSKSKLVDQVGEDIKIEQLNANGESVEIWTIHNPMFLDVGFGSLSYDTDEISKITVKVAYDYAKIQVGKDEANVIP